MAELFKIHNKSNLILTNNFILAYQKKYVIANQFNNKKHFIGDGRQDH